MDVKWDEFKEQNGEISDARGACDTAIGRFIGTCRMYRRSYS
jgi:hypothetical protein